METTTCNYCGSAGFEVIHRLPDLLLDRPDVITQLVRCTQCALVYQNPRPTFNEMGAHYPPEYDSYTPNLAEQKIPWLLRRAYNYGIGKRMRMITDVKPGGRLLDVGCATGTFLNGMRAHPQWTLFGVEVNEHAARIAQDSGLNVFTGTLEAARFPDNHFDAITLWDVFEHLHDPRASLAELHRILAPGGVLVMRVPNLDSWDAKWFGETWAGLDAPRHLYIFSLEALRKFLGATGFNPIGMKCNIGSYPTFVLSIRFWLTARGTPAAKRKAIMRILEHPIARIVSAPLFYLTNIGLRGPLVTVRAYKPREL